MKDPQEKTVTDRPEQAEEQAQSQQTDPRIEEAVRRQQQAMGFT